MRGSSSWFTLQKVQPVAFSLTTALRPCSRGSPDHETRNAYIPLGPRDSFPFIERRRLGIASGRPLLFNLQVRIAYATDRSPRRYVPHCGNPLQYSSWGPPCEGSTTTLLSGFLQPKVRWVPYFAHVSSGMRLSGLMASKFGRCTPGLRIKADLRRWLPVLRSIEMCHLSHNICRLYVPSRPMTRKLQNKRSPHDESCEFSSDTRFLCGDVAPTTL